MQLPRFTFLLSSTLAAVADVPAGRVSWMLVSNNNRQLGRGAAPYATYAAAQAAVRRVRSRATDAVRVVAPDETTGQWTWTLKVDGAAVAVSSRTYLRLRECQYNLDRFLEAIPLAQIAEGTRTSRSEPVPGLTDGTAPMVRR